MKKVVANPCLYSESLVTVGTTVTAFTAICASLFYSDQLIKPRVVTSIAPTGINQSGDMVVFSRTHSNREGYKPEWVFYGAVICLAGLKTFGPKFLPLLPNMLKEYFTNKNSEPQTQPKRPRSNSDPIEVRSLYVDVEHRNALINEGESFKPNFQFVEWDDDLLVLKMKTPMGIVHNFGFSSDKSSYPPSLSRIELTAVEKAGSDFARENGIYQVGKLKTLLEVTNVPGLVFAKYKSIDQDQAIILSNWIIALFAVDDRFDLVRNGQYTPSDAVKKLAKLKTNVLRVISKDRNKDLAKIYKDVKKDDDPGEIPSEVKALANAFKAALTYISTKVEKEKQPSIIYGNGYLHLKVMLIQSVTKSLEKNAKIIQIFMETLLTILEMKPVADCMHLS